MKFTNEKFNLYLERYKKVIDELSVLKRYPSNIKHLLYVIVPAFIFKYGIEHERLIISMFSETSIIINDKSDKVYQASFSRTLKFVDDTYKTDKYIFLNNYQNVDLMQLLDNLIHEFNHVINSILNEIRWDNKYVYLRTGLTYLLYDKNTLEPVMKQDDVVLEEIINTRQTESIMNIISSFSEYLISDTEISNIIYTVNRSISSYRSGAYYLQTTVCKKLLENKTFIHTLESLRFQGEIYDIDGWFDNIVGKDGSFKRVQKLLSDTLELEEDLAKTKWFKNRKVQKIVRLSRELFEIVEKFNQNCNFR